MKNLTLENIAGACAGKLILPDNWETEKGGREASCVVIDSRKIEPEGIFIATRGEKVDGHSACKVGNGDCHEESDTGKYSEGLRRKACSAG